MNAASFCPLGAGSPLSPTLHCPQSLFARRLWRLCLLFSCCPQWLPPAGGTDCRRRPHVSLAQAQPRCHWIPVTGGRTRPSLFRVALPGPSRLLLCLERCTVSSFAGRSEDVTRRSWGIRCVASHCESRRLSSTLSLHGVASWLHALVTQTIAMGCVGTWASPEGTCGGPACVLGPGVHLRDCGPFSQNRILHTGLFPSVCPGWASCL